MQLKALRMQEFVMDVMRVTDGVYDAPALSKYESISRDKTEGVRGVWVAWAKYERDEGTTVAMAALKGGRLHTRPHPDLPPDSDVEWPHNLQVKRKREYEDTSMTAHESQRAKSEALSDATPQWRATMQAAMMPPSSGEGYGSGSSGHAPAAADATTNAMADPEEPQKKTEFKELDKVMEQATASQTTVMKLTIVTTIAATFCRLIQQT